jgi:hypothetical protein
VTATENSLPEQEINRRVRVNELIDECASSFNDMIDDFNDVVKYVSDRMIEAKANLFTDMDEFMAEISRRSRPETQEILNLMIGKFGTIPFAQFAKSPLAAPEVANTRRERMCDTIERLLREAEPVEGTSERVLTECQVILKSGFQGIGVLRKSPEGLLSFMSTGQAGKQVVTVEYFFDVDDLEALVLMRGAMPVQPKSTLFGAT